MPKGILPFSSLRMGGGVRSGVGMGVRIPLDSLDFQGIHRSLPLRISFDFKGGTLRSQREFRGILPQKTTKSKKANENNEKSGPVVVVVVVARAAPAPPPAFLAAQIYVAVAPTHTPPRTPPTILLGPDLRRSSSPLLPPSSAQKSTSTSELHKDSKG